MGMARFPRFFQFAIPISYVCHKSFFANQESYVLLSIQFVRSNTIYSHPTRFFQSVVAINQVVSSRRYFSQYHRL